MKRTILLIIMLLLLAGCAATYRHPVKSGDAFEKDRQICEAAARKTLSAKGIPNT